MTNNKKKYFFCDRFNELNISISYKNYKSIFFVESLKADAISVKFKHHVHVLV